MAKDGAKEPTKTAAPGARTLYTFSEPVTFNGETITELGYRRATARDIRQHYNRSGTPLGDKYVAFLVNITEMPAAFFDELPAGDFVALTNLVDGFFAVPKAATSETSTA